MTSRSRAHCRRKLRGLWRRVGHAQIFGPAARYEALGRLMNVYYRQAGGSRNSADVNASGHVRTDSRNGLSERQNSAS